MTTQTFTVVGITVHKDGTTKVRFTDDMARRVKQFYKGGATRVDFIELPSPMNKIDALKYLLTSPKFASAEDQSTINDSLEDKLKEQRKGQTKVKVTPSIAEIKKRTRKNVQTTTANDVLNAVTK